MTDKRLFIAIPLPDDIKKELHRVQSMLKPISEGIKWTNQDLMHVTLKFLGETPSWILEDVKNEFKRIVESTEKFEMQLSVLGQFPKEGDPRIMIAGLQKSPQIVYKLCDELNTGYLALGFDDTGKKFHPHITIGRIKHKYHEDLLSSYYDIAIEPMVFKVEKIVLFESCYPHGKLDYVPLEEITLI